MADQADLGHFDHSKTAEQGILPGVARPLKVVFLGAGSGFLQTLFVDILNIPGAAKGELALVDVDAERLELAEGMCRKLIDAKGADWTVTATADRRAVLEGAHYVINCIEVSGVQCVRFDYEIPKKFGVDQCIGDTCGPGGLMKALRTVPVFLEVLYDIEELCPDAWVLNYTNPMSIMCLAAAMDSDANVVGLCHSVQGTSHALARYADVPYEEMTWRCGGVNHLAWFTELTHNGESLYPMLYDKARQRGDWWEQDPVRFDMMLHLGYFVTESSGHFSEYLPFYRKRDELIDEYCRDRYRGERGFYANGWPQWRKACDQKRRQIVEGETDVDVSNRSWEYASRIIEAMETHQPFVIYGTVPNSGLIDNLNTENVVEVGCLVDRNGITPTRFGPLPPQCAAICEWNQRMYELAAIACVEHDREAAIHSLMVDPLTAAVCSPAEIRKMAEELFDAEQEFIPELF